jgi:tripartite-type tricarboxylate transporter receptor subunit TctC
MSLHPGKPGAVAGTRAIAFAVFATLLSPSAAVSQSWPSRPVNILVTQPAGGIADILAREIAQALAQETGQPFVVENRPGASGNLAAAAAAKACPTTRPATLCPSCWSANRQSPSWPA